MRRRNADRMTVVEQIVSLRDDVCEYACKHIDKVNAEHSDPLFQRIFLQEYCQKCPMNKLHYK